MPNGIKLTLNDWVHICDAHSILTNGNEVDKDRYSSTQEAFISAIHLDDLLRETRNVIQEIEGNWDSCAERESNKVAYIKKIKYEENKYKEYCLVVDKTNNTIDTLFVIGEGKYASDFQKIVETLLQPGSNAGTINGFIRNGKAFYEFEQIVVK